MQIKANTYGIHEVHGGISFLEQAEGGTNALGIDLKSPFKVSCRGVCPHAIDISLLPPDPNEWKFFQSFAENDMLVRMLMPKIPGRKKLYFIGGFKNDVQYIATLLQMYAPTTDAVVTPSTEVAPNIPYKLEVTNLMPLFITNIMPRNNVVTNLAVKATVSPRSLLLNGDYTLLMPAGVTRLQTTVFRTSLDEIQSLDMVSIGAEITRRVMRKEPVF
jgi:hypothetical protein